MSQKPAGPVENLHRRLGLRIRARRQALGLTLEALESSSGVGAAFVGQIERGVKKPSLETLARVARGLGLPLSKLLGEDAPAADGEGSVRKVAALLRGHEPHEREFLYAALRHLSRRLHALSRAHPSSAKTQLV